MSEIIIVREGTRETRGRKRKYHSDKPSSANERKKAMRAIKKKLGMKVNQRWDE